jgi:hypothetical protein
MYFRVIVLAMTFVKNLKKAVSETRRMRVLQMKEELKTATKNKKIKD